MGDDKLGLAAFFEMIVQSSTLTTVKKLSPHPSRLPDCPWESFFLDGSVKMSSSLPFRLQILYLLYRLKGTHAQDFIVGFSHFFGNIQ
jgi:hypothetical protein